MLGKVGTWNKQEVAWPEQRQCELSPFHLLPSAPCFPSSPHLHSFLSLPSLFCFNSYLNQNCLLLSKIKTQTALQDFLQIVSPQLHLSPASFYLQAITFNSFNGFFGNFTVSLNNMFLLLLPGVSALDISYYILTSHYGRWRFRPAPGSLTGQARSHLGASAQGFFCGFCVASLDMYNLSPLPMDYFFPPSSSSNIIILVS